VTDSHSHMGMLLTLSAVHSSRHSYHSQADKARWNSTGAGHASQLDTRSAGTSYQDSLKFSRYPAAAVAY
jgi:hypothetical protein